MNQLHDHLLVARGLAERGRWVEAQNFLLQCQGSDVKVKDPVEAQVGMMTLYHSLINAGDWTGAALLRWGKTLFNPDARSVKLIWKHLTNPTENKILIMGCGSSGKTYSTSAWINMNWDRDPQFTAGKIISTTFGHNKSGIMSRIGTFHTNSLFKFPGEPIAGGLQYPGADKSASILAIAIPEGESGEGRLTGFHPYPRPEPHPVFGELSRVFAVIDEADVVAEGLWSGIDNQLGNEDTQGSVRVIALTNPRLKHNSFAHRAEPEGGWSSLDENTDEWVSREGWNVISIDGAKSENVIQKKKVFPGLLTYQGYMNYVRKGKHDPSYWTYARGKYPPDSVDTFNVFSLSMFDDSVGRLMFEGEVTPIASLDPAFAEGGDTAVLTIARFGKAIGFTNQKQEYIHYPKVRKAVQVEAQIILQKGKTQDMAVAVIQILRSYGVRPEWFVMDKTGNARGLYDNICWRFGKVMGVEWGAKATETKILFEDTDVAAERFKGIAAEMWFANAGWLETGYIKFSPTMEGLIGLRDELTQRRWKFNTTFQQLEDKATFKAANHGKSCDKADSYIMVVHPIRMHSHGLPTFVNEKMQSPQMRALWEREDSLIDKPLEYVPDEKIFI